MKNIKKSEIKPHIYQFIVLGSLVNFPKCSICELDRDDHIHYRNAGQICDTYRGPCACGAWH